MKSIFQSIKAENGSGKANYSFRSPMFHHILKKKHYNARYTALETWSLLSHWNGYLSMKNNDMIENSITWRCYTASFVHTARCSTTAVQWLQFLPKLLVTVSIDTRVDGSIQEVRPHKGIVNLGLWKGQLTVQVTCQEEKQRQHVMRSGASNVSECHGQKRERFSDRFGNATSVGPSRTGIWIQGHGAYSVFEFSRLQDSFGDTDVHNNKPNGDYHKIKKRGEMVNRHIDRIFVSAVH